MSQRTNQEPLGDNSAVRSWPKTVPKWIGLGLFIYASVAALAQAKSFLVPVVLAFLLSMVFAPIRRVFDRRRVSSSVSSLAIVLMLLAGFLGIAMALAMPVATWMENAPQIERQVQRKVRDISVSLNGLYEANKRINEAADTASSDVTKVEVADNNVVTSAALLAPGVMTQFVFTFVLLLFLLASGDMFYEKLVHVIPKLKDKRRAVRIVYGIERQLSQYLMTITAITAINAGLGVCVGVAMWLLGMPSALVFGVIAFVFNFVPYLGAVAGIAIASAVALVAFDGIGLGVIVAGVYFLLTAIEGQFVTPYFVGRKLQINTVMVFLAVSFWAWLWSVVGMIVAVPLLVAVKTFCDHIDNLHDLGDFLSVRHAELDTSAADNVANEGPT